MPTEFTSGNVDFDELFDPDIMGDGPQAGWLENLGVPLRYARLAYGSKRPDVGYEDAGVDVSNLWAAKGTAVYVIVGLHGKALYAGDQALTTQGIVNASVALSLNSNGTWTVVGGTAQQGPVVQPAPTSGSWLPAGHSNSDYQVQYDVVSAGAGGRIVKNGAGAYASLTASRSVSLALPDAPASNANERSATATVSIRLRRTSTGTVSITNITMEVYTAGFA